MREKYTFFLGLGIGIVIVCLVSIFLYNTLPMDNVETKKIERKYLIEE